MARGFDSKSVADQQEAAQNLPRARTQPLVSAHRRKLELTKADLLRRLQGASGLYEEMLRRSLAAVEEELAREG